MGFFLGSVITETSATIQIENKPITLKVNLIRVADLPRNEPLRGDDIQEVPQSVTRHLYWTKRCKIKHPMLIFSFNQKIHFRAPHWHWHVNMNIAVQSATPLCHQRTENGVIFLERKHPAPPRQLSSQSSIKVSVALWVSWQWSLHCWMHFVKSAGPSANCPGLSGAVYPGARSRR